MGSSEARDFLTIPLTPLTATHTPTFTTSKFSTNIQFHTKAKCVPISMSDADHCCSPPSSPEQWPISPLWVLQCVGYPSEHEAAPASHITTHHNRQHYSCHLPQPYMTITVSTVWYIVPQCKQGTRSCSTGERRVSGCVVHRPER